MASLEKNCLRVLRNINAGGVKNLGIGAIGSSAAGAARVVAVGHKQQRRPSRRISVHKSEKRH